MIINSKDSFFSFVDAAEFPEITLLQLCRQRGGGLHDSHCVPHVPPRPPSMISCCCKSSGYGACVVVFNDYVRYIERLNFFACLPYTEKKSSSIVASNAAQLFCGWQIPPDWMWWLWHRSSLQMLTIQFVTGNPCWDLPPSPLIKGSGTWCAWCAFAHPLDYFSSHHIQSGEICQWQDSWGALLANILLDFFSVYGNQAKKLSHSIYQT